MKNNKIKTRQSNAVQSREREILTGKRTIQEVARHKRRKSIVKMKLYIGLIKNTVICF